ncbi:alpha/beta fold hydrolase [Nocardia sp. alder85J]|uniref:alpha/beta fold hydrolase n=1 Tax=Nocardia sp. alder85J TaxID=2862949 RepID=UPI001CD6D915|nr:alpha/beta fold hydrolase [Nocardia sp. alder85J]MCX4099066.1 alpha/beta fold hydrolase [Nocardia sp. alder85J]
MTGNASQQVMLVVEITVKPGAQREMREELDRLVDATRREDGVVRFEVGLDPADDTRVVGYEIWASQDALDAHRAQAHTRAFRERVRELVVDPAAPLHTGRWRPMREELPAAYVPGPVPAAAVPPGFGSAQRVVDDVRLHYVIGGNGSPVVLLHGFPNTWYAWREVMPRLAERHTVVAVDLRGLGDSEAGTQIDDVVTGVADLHGLIAGLGLGPVLLAGQDWGGSTAFAFAAAHPDEVRRLAVVEAMPAGPWTVPGPGAWFVGFHQIPELPERMVAGRERTYLEWFYRAYSATPGVPTAAAVDEYLRCYTRPGAMAAAFDRYRGRAREIEHNAKRLSRPLDLPVLAVGGERSIGAAVAANLRHGASDVREELLAGCGHYVSEERPGELAELLLDFFGE